jgi:hypothetical protein
MDALFKRQQVHRLVDEDEENLLDALLELLTHSPSRYTQEEINSFYTRIKLFEESGSKGSSVAEAHANIRSNYYQRLDK